MVKIMSVLMKETMELRGDCQREGREPEQQHRIRNGEFADVAPMPGCSPKLHAMVIEHGFKGKARGIRNALRKWQLILLGSDFRAGQSVRSGCRRAAT
jgi:hypothetical protein